MFNPTAREAPANPRVLLHLLLCLPLLSSQITGKERSLNMNVCPSQPHTVHLSATSSEATRTGGFDRAVNQGRNPVSPPSHTQQPSSHNSQQDNRLGVYFFQSLTPSQKTERGCYKAILFLPPPFSINCERKIHESHKFPLDIFMRSL